MRFGPVEENRWSMPARATSATDFRGRIAGSATIGGGGGGGPPSWNRRSCLAAVHVGVVPLRSRPRSASRERRAPRRCRCRHHLRAATRRIRVDGELVVAAPPSARSGGGGPGGGVFLHLESQPRVSHGGATRSWRTVCAAVLSCGRRPRRLRAVVTPGRSRAWCGVIVVGGRSCPLRPAEHSSALMPM